MVECNGVEFRQLTEVDEDASGVPNEGIEVPVGQIACRSGNTWIHGSAASHDPLIRVDGNAPPPG